MGGCAYPNGFHSIYVEFVTFHSPVIYDSRYAIPGARLKQVLNSAPM
jgi:hypothetical protein